MESRTTLLLSELRRCPRTDQLAVIRSLLRDWERPIAPPAPHTLPPLSPEDWEKLHRRLAALDDSYDLDEFMARLAQEVESRAARS